MHSKPNSDPRSTRKILPVYASSSLLPAISAAQTSIRAASHDGYRWIAGRRFAASCLGVNEASMQSAVAGTCNHAGRRDVRPDDEFYSLLTPKGARGPLSLKWRRIWAIATTRLLLCSRARTWKIGFLGMGETEPWSSR